MSLDRDLALVGTGYWGKNLLRNFWEIGALSHICDTNEEALANFSKTYPGLKTSTSFETILSNAEIKKVVIAAPAFLHFELVKKALEAGKDVFVEKPLALDVEQGNILCDLAEQMGQILMVGHILLYHPAVMRIRKELKNNKVGKILSIESNRMSLGKLRTEENVLWSFAPHDISMVLSFINDEIETLSCTGKSFLHPGVEDSCHLDLCFSSGAVAHIFTSWVNPFKEHRLTIVGEDGAIIFDDTKDWSEKLSFIPKSIFIEASGARVEKQSVEYIELEQGEPLKNECLHFLESCKTRKAPVSSGLEGLEGLRVLQHAQKSMENKGRVIEFNCDMVCS